MLLRKLVFTLMGLGLAVPALAEEAPAAAPAAASAAQADAATAPAEAAALPVAATPTTNPGPRPKMWPDDQTWPKTGKTLLLPLIDATVHFPKDSPNTWILLPELGGDGRDSHATRIQRSAGGPPVEIEIRFTAITLSSIFDPCGDYWGDFPDVKHFDRTSAWPQRIETKMGRFGNTYIACLALKQDDRKCYSDFRTETSTTITIGRRFQTGKSGGAAFNVTYDGDTNSADFATVAADIEAIVGTVQEAHGDSGTSVIEAWAAYSMLTTDHTAIGGTGDTRHGIKLRIDTTPYRGFPYSVMSDINAWGGGGGAWMIDTKLGLGLGYFIADFIGVSVHGTASLEGGADAKSPVPLLLTYGASATVAANIGPWFRVRAYLQPSYVGAVLQGDDTQLKDKDLQTGKSLFGFDEAVYGGHLEWNIVGRSAANGGSKGSSAAFFVGYEHRDQWNTSSNALIIGFGNATGSFKAPAIDPKASPGKDMTLFSNN
jgi:hypothetical protein